MPPSNAIPNTCPDCGEVGTITMDDQLGEIACNECGLVLKGGLEESATTAFHSDQVTGSTALAQLRSGGAEPDKKDYRAQTMKTLQILRSRFDAPDSVLNDAKALADEYLDTLAEQNSGKPSSHDCFAIALFHVSSLRMRFPLSQPQLIKELSAQLNNNAPQVVRDLVNSIVRNMKIALPEAEVVMKDLVFLLLERMHLGTAAASHGQQPQFPREPTLTMASALAATYSEKVPSPAEQRVVAAASIFISMTSRAAREHLAPRVVAALNAELRQVSTGGGNNKSSGGVGGGNNVSPGVLLPTAKQWTKEEMQQMEGTLARLIRDDTKALRACMKYLSSNSGTVQEWIAAAVKRFPAVSAAAATEGASSKASAVAAASAATSSGTRRDRGE